ncbi:flotillin family protein [Streptomyces subrutilus]|uniref:Flotillin family protein n=1 Tax=Streptomyces subrutilus TaxID=36818 RepID=A0A5P2UJ43_9ACTN|nr:flotillin family protein [Streptomyces subrutilus]QEU77504.1 flotillin family protein [Streptomyces subrutilus]GGZ48033.1 flotillin family protein [Streptomyces subrutilus]
MLFWHVPAPNEALLISGSKRRAGDAQFRIVTGHGCWVMPVKQKASLLSLSLREAEIAEECVTQQGIRIAVRAVAVFKVGDDQTSIANAARRFLDEQTGMEQLVGRIFAGHLRSIIGGLTVEEIIRERDRVAQEIKEGSHSEMEKLGIVVDALQIQEIGDVSGYITNLAAPHAAAVASTARIAQAKSDQEATEREQQAAALKAQYERDTAIKRAGFLAETEQSNALAAQAGPLSQARASQEVIEAQTALAERQAGLAAQRLEAEVRRPADAEAYRQRTLAEAGRDRTLFEADGRAYTERTVAQAHADANDLLAASLRHGNQELIAASRVVEQLPALAEAAAKGMADAQITVLNGAEGLGQVVSGIVGQGLGILDVLRKKAVGTPQAGTADVPSALVNLDQHPAAPRS